MQQKSSGFQPLNIQWQSLLAASVVQSLCYFYLKIIDKNGTSFMYGIIFSGFVLYTLMIFTLSIITDIKIVWGLALFIGLMYGILLPAWNTFMASHIHMDEQEETWGVFNSVQGFGSMIGPLVGGLITEFSKSVNNT